MKWIGQHIWDYISRFRSDVYLENIDSGTIASGGNLGLDSNNKIVKATSVASVSVADNSSSTFFPVVFHDESNGLLDDTGSFEYSPQLGLTLITGGVANISIDQSSGSGTSGQITLSNFRSGGVGSDGDYTGKIDFKGMNDAVGSPEQITFATIIGQISDRTDGQEAGKLSFYVAEYDGTITTAGLILDGDTDADGEIDVTIGAGAASTTTIAGDLTVTSGLTIGGHKFDDIDIGSEFVDTDDHIMSSGAIKEKIESYGYVTSNTMGSGFTVSATTDSNATTITQGDDLFFAAGTGITCETTADGTVTITNTVSDTNTTYTAGTGLDLGGTEFTVDVSDFMTNGVDNRVVTATGADAMNAEAKLTWDGDDFIIASDNQNKPNVYITNAHNSAKPPTLYFKKDKGAAGAPNDAPGLIIFQGDNDAEEQTVFASIEASVSSAVDTDEAGSIQINVATSDGTTSVARTAVAGYGNATANTVGVNLGYGSASLTTIAGDLDIDGHAITSAGDLTFTPGGLFKTVASGVEIENGSTTGAPALLIDNDDADQVALSIDAANTTADIISVTGNATTTGSFINYTGVTNGSNSGGLIDINLTNTDVTSAGNTGIHIDYDKSGVMGASQLSTFTGLSIDFDDTATNNASSIHINSGIVVALTNSSDQGTITQTGATIICQGGDTDRTNGVYLNTPDGSSDIKIVSSANTLDYFTIGTTEDGETTLTTVEDGGGSTAHMNLVADGKIILDSADDIEINADGGDINFKDNTLNLAKINAAEGLWIGQAGTSNSQVTFETSTENVIFRAPADAATDERTITLPDATGTVQLQGENTGQVVHVNIRDNGSYLFYLFNDDFWYSAGTTTLAILGSSTSPGDISSANSEYQGRVGCYTAIANCTVKKLVFTFYWTSSSVNSADVDFAFTKFTPITDGTAATITMNAIAATDHNASYTEVKPYQVTFTFSGGNASLSAGDSFGFHMRTTGGSSSQRVLVYGSAVLSVELD